MASCATAMPICISRHITLQVLLDRPRHGLVERTEILDRAGEIAGLGRKARRQGLGRERRQLADAALAGGQRRPQLLGRIAQRRNNAQSRDYDAASHASATQREARQRDIKVKIAIVFASRRPVEAEPLSTRRPHTILRAVLVLSRPDRGCHDSTCHARFVLRRLLATPWPAADFTQLREDNWDAFVPQGKEVDAIYGDYVLRNDKSSR